MYIASNFSEAAALSFGVSSVWVNHFTSMAAVDCKKLLRCMRIVHYKPHRRRRDEVQLLVHRRLHGWRGHRCVFLSMLPCIISAQFTCFVSGTYIAFLLICHGPTGELPDKSPTMAKLLAAGGNMKELTRVSNGERLPVSLFTEFKVFCLRWRCAWAALSLALAIGTAHYVGA